MSILRITNVSPGNLWLRDLYTELSPGETATIKRTPAEMGDMVGLQEYLANGKVVVDIDLEAYESSGELVPVWPLGLNGRPAVPTTVALPLLNNRLGDTRLVIDILQQFAWNGTVWVGIGGGGGGGVTSVTASLPLSSSGGATPIISLGTVGVGNGGTGATTLTGYVKGTGTSALTASATIPGSDISGNISGNAANVTSTVAIANGGTGQTSLTANAVVLGNGALAVQTVAPGTSGNVLTSNGTTWSSAPPLATEYDQQIFVAAGADPLVATGAPLRPFASISAAMAAITDAAPSKRYAISVAAGSYTEASALDLKPNVFIIGVSRDAVRITAPSFGLDASFTGTADNRSGISNAIVTGTASFNFTTVTSAEGKLYFRDTSFNSALTLTGYNNATVQAQFSGCQMYAVLTVQGVNIGVFNDNVLFSHIVLTQSPFGGVPTILTATGGSCIGTVTATTTVNDFNRRISIFARSFWMNGAVTVDGPSSYLDYTVDSLPSGGASTPNGGNLVSIDFGANKALSNLVYPTAVNNPIIPASTNATNMGDWNKQWFFSFGYVHLSSGTDLYIGSAGTSAAADSAGRAVYLQPDQYGIDVNVNGGVLDLRSANATGTGISGNVDVNTGTVVNGNSGDVTLTTGRGLAGAIAAGSNGQALPSAVINVASLTGFPSTGTILVATSTGTQTVTYTGTTSASTTVAAGSNGQALPQGTINVASTASFLAAGTLRVTTSGGVQTVTYTGKTANSFTGCTGGAGTMSTGGAVAQDVFTGCAGGTGTMSTGGAIEFSGIGTRGIISLDGREIDANSTKIVNLANGVNANDAVNKSQLDANVATYTADQTLTTANDVALIDAPSNTALTITLPTAVGNSGKRLVVKKIDGFSGQHIVAATLGQSIDGAGSYTILTQWEALTVVSNSTNWFIII
jgi:hypothetical protein